MNVNSGNISLAEASAEDGLTAENEGLPMTIQEDAKENDTQQTQNKNGESCRSSNPSKTKLNVKIRGWNGVATWKWIANDDTCGICRVAFDGCCPGWKITFPK